MEAFAPFLAAFGVFLIAVGPVGIADTKIVDWFRNAFDKDGGGAPWIWSTLAIVVGLVLAIGFQLNFAGPVVAAVPALASASPHLVGVWGQALTGLGIAGASGYWHAKLQGYNV